MSNKPIITLGIETSCDETALAIIETRGEGTDFEARTLASLVHSQAELHSAYGGVYPTLAKREHGKNIVPLLHKLLIKSGELLEWKKEMAAEHLRSVTESFHGELEGQNPELFKSFGDAGFLLKAPRIDRIAVTEGPGLEPALWVGINLARMLGALWQVPVVPVNHMEGHVVASLFPPEIANGAMHKIADLPLPAAALLISGGHTQLVRMEAIGRYEIIGETLDDAVGEAFDKTARLLGLPYPGGPQLSMMAARARETGIESPLKLPRPMIHSKDLNLSFSGLKTAVLYAVGKDSRDERWKMGLAREVEDAITETLDAKLRAAIEAIGARSIIVGGGVAANSSIRASFERTADEYGLPLFLPSSHVSGDNALMIALAAALGADRDAAKTASSAELKAQGTKRL